VPAILATMSLVIANAISISVRERRTEMAVLKVLGFSPNMVMALILGEALLVGFLGGILSVTIAYVFVNDIIGGFPFPIAFFPKFFVPDAAFGWGLEFGTITAFVGSVLPAALARNVKASDVFAKVA
jgi:putative ABC transport system permease protein